MVAGIVLAAGGSTRMGRPKMLLPIGDRTVLAAAIAPLLTGGLERVVVVLGAGAEEVRRRAGLPEDSRLCVVVNEGWAEGMSSSLRRGLDECEGAGAAVVSLGDQPGVAVDIVRRLVQAHREGAVLALPVHGTRASHPVLFAHELWDELRDAAGDKGGRDVVKRHWAEATLLETPPVHDLDTEEDYRAMLSGKPAPANQGLKLPPEE